MNSLTILYIFLALLFSFVLVYYQYYFRTRKNSSNLILSVLRFVSIFSILLLWINPQFLSRRFFTIKPKLAVAIDNSSSIKFSKQDTLVQELIKKIKTDRELNDKFEIDYFTFGDHLQLNQDLTFQEDRTNINESLKELNELGKKKKDPIILISDGNQTYGSDYKYYVSNRPIFPIILGDTTQVSDIEIDRINVNSYTYLKNNFPVEIFVNYFGDKKIQTKITVEKEGKLYYSKKIKFSNANSGYHLQFKLPAEKTGKHFYSVKVQPFEKEANIKNNSKNFTIEVIDEQTNVGLVYDVLHPDIGMIKRVIETNEQRKLNLINLNEPVDLSHEQDIYILYQPTVKFQNVIELINRTDAPTFYITGKNVDWNYLNQAQNYFRKINPSSQESYYPDYNKNFNLFFAEDIGFADFSPLEGQFGEIKIISAGSILLYQKINGIATKKPLLLTFSDDAKRSAVLFGENSWKWRLTSYNANQSFAIFDQFFNSIIQFLAVANKKNTIELNYKSFYYNNEPIKITAKSYDKNLNFDKNAELDFKLDNDLKVLPFYLMNNSFELVLSDLKSGKYHFSVVNKASKERQYGTFVISEFAVEQELLHANEEGLKALAINSKGKSYYPLQIKYLKQKLASDKEYVPVQKEKNKLISLIDWKWLLGIIILSLSLEWFLRKYKGLV